MIYVALLRGINVGGKNLMKMDDLKIVFEKLAFSNVVTYIQSGNVIFDSKSKQKESLVGMIEDALQVEFHKPVRVVVRSYEEMKQTLKDIPLLWKSKEDLRKYIAFVKEPSLAKDIFPQITINDGVDYLHAADGVLYMTTRMSGITKSGFTKIIGKPFYSDLTIRNFNTTQKIIEMMEGSYEK